LSDHYISKGDMRLDGKGAALPEGLTAGAALGRVAEPEEFVGAALHLASEACPFCTGTTLTLDGGVK
jgi:NAD(P)-dependent dehydrogenase (short-subunit alcohol dehydrogenase family)